MPEYLFESPKTGERKLLFYTMKDAPKVGSVVTIDGAKWKRIFTKPNAAVDTKIDPNSAQDFVRATNKRGTLGDLWDRSAELSEKRAAKEGSDPLKEKFYKEFSKKRRGKKHPQQVREEGAKKLKEAGLSIDWGD